MRSILSLLAVCTICFVTACESTDKDKASMGAISSDVSKCGADCSKACCNKDASMGAVGDKSGCSQSGAVCPVTGKAADTSMGAVSDQKSGCCSGKAADTSMGVIGDAPACGTKSSCSGKATDASLGAVSEKSGCSKSQSSCTKSANDA